MKLLYSFPKIRAIFMAPAVLLALASCSSYQYAGYESDGIYSTDTPEIYTEDQVEKSYEDALHYEQIFATQSERFGTISEEGSIFTDIDSYSSVGAPSDADFAEGNSEFSGGYPAWGTDADEIAINIYANPYYNPYRFYGPFINPYRNPYYGYSYAYGYGFGWPYDYGYYSPWNYGWGHGYNSWRMGYAFNPYQYGYYGLYRNHVPYYYTNPRNVAYNSGRRNSSIDYNGGDYTRRNSEEARSSRIADYSNSRDVRAERSNRIDDNVRTYRTRTTRVESPERARTERTYRTSTNTRTSSPERVRTTRTRSSNSTPTVRRTSTPTRSSSTVRPTTNTRSSGSTSSSRSTRGRG